MCKLFAQEFRYNELNTSEVIILSRCHQRKFKKKIIKPTASTTASCSFSKNRIIVPREENRKFSKNLRNMYLKSGNNYITVISMLTPIKTVVNLNMHVIT